MKCQYGCGKEAKYQTKQGKWICSKSSNQCEVNKQKNSKGLKKAYQEGRKKGNLKFGKIGSDANNKRLEKIYENIEFKKLPKHRRIKILLEEQDYKCKICGIKKWNDKELVLECDHIDGKHSNNKKENLRMICPNCHSQTETWKGRNKNRTKVSDKEILNTIPECYNISQVLTKVGLSKGWTYYRIIKLLSQNPHIQLKEKEKKRKRERTTKIQWPDYDKLKQMVDDNNYSSVGRELGVSDNAVRKRLKKIWPDGGTVDALDSKSNIQKSI